jgi:hypothetical protein
MVQYHPGTGGMLLFHSNLNKWTLNVPTRWSAYRRRWSVIVPPGWRFVRHHEEDPPLLPVVDATASLGYDAERACWEILMQLRCAPWFDGYIQGHSANGVDAERVFEYSPEERYNAFVLDEHMTGKYEPEEAKLAAGGAGANDDGIDDAALLPSSRGGGGGGGSARGAGARVGDAAAGPRMLGRSAGEEEEAAEKDSGGGSGGRHGSGRHHHTRDRAAAGGAADDAAAAAAAAASRAATAGLDAAHLRAAAEAEPFVAAERLPVHTHTVHKITPYIERILEASFASHRGAVMEVAEMETLAASVGIDLVTLYIWWDGRSKGRDEGGGRALTQLLEVLRQRRLL